MAPERDFRGPGCTERCVVVQAFVVGVFGRSDLLLHSAADHERHGRLQAGGKAHLIVTGPLVLDLDGCGVTLDGEPKVLAAVELRLLFALGLRAGQWIRTPDLVTSVWGRGRLDEPHLSYRHTVRVAMARLRKRIYPAGGLIATYPGVGYRLEIVEPGAAAPSGAGNYRLRIDRWAVHWDACRVCGLVDLPHVGGGSCGSCMGRDRPRPHRGRAAALQATGAQRALSATLGETR